jgi:uncharacterized membrane protein
MIRCWLGVFAVVFATAGAAAAQTAPYDFVKVYYPGSVYTDVAGINNAGQVVGTYQEPGSPAKVHGFVFDGTNYTTMDFPGTNLNFALGIGNGGEILGTYASQWANTWTGWVKDAQGFRTIQYPPGRSTDVRAINASGQIVGSWDTGGPTPEPAHGFMVDGDVFELVDYPGALHRVANGINDAGIITGTYFNIVNGKRRLRGFGRSGGQYFGLHFPGAVDTGIGAINNQNRIVGWSKQGTKFYGFVWADNGYRTFAVPFAGATNTMALGINDLGQVTGLYQGPDCFSWCGFIATPKPEAVPVCSQTFSLEYANSTLKLKFSLKTTMPFTWATWVIHQNIAYPIFSAALPAQPNLVNVEYPIGNFPNLGAVSAVSTFTTSEGVSMCADLASINTAQ